MEFKKSRIIIVLILIVVMIFFTSCGSDPETDAKICAEKAVLDRLRAPSTAEFPNYDEFRVKSLGDDRYQISGHVEAQNAFGGTVRTGWIVKLTLTNSGFKDEEVTIFD
jgi:hypothetical protein